MCQNTFAKSHDLTVQVYLQVNKLTVLMIYSSWHLHHLATLQWYTYSHAWDVSVNTKDDTHSLSSQHDVCTCQTCHMVFVHEITHSVPLRRDHTHVDYVILLASTVLMWTIVMATIISLVFCCCQQVMTCILVCYPVSILVCLRLNLSTVCNLYQCTLCSSYGGNYLEILST